MKNNLSQKEIKSVKVNAAEDMLLIDSSLKFNDSMPSLSIVVPVYNVEKFLERCLESLINQTYKNIEIICVNDASKGSEDEIIRRYCQLDKRIKYVKHEKNMGLFQARITGMKYAKGEYFAFLDSDDHISMDYYRILMEKITDEKADIVIGDFVDEYEDGRIEYYNYDNVRFKDIVLKDDEVYDTFMKQHGLWFGWHTVWNKVYKMGVWNDSVKSLEQFSKSHGHLIMTEDIAFSCTFWRHADKVVNAHNAFYYYYHHSGQSVANSSLDKFKKNAKDVACVFKYFKDLLVEENIYEKYKYDYDKFLNVYIGFWTGNSNALSGDDKKKGREYIQELFGTTMENEYKDHFHYSMRTSLATFEWYEEIKRSICKKSTEVVSFDIFDTLLLRPFLLPSDLFCLMDDKFNEVVAGLSYVDFQKIRINTEASLRQKMTMGQEEVTLDSIYEVIGKIFSLSNDQINTLKNYEIELELKFIQPRKCGMELYKLAKHLKKRVIFVSDIYLPQEVIAKMIEKCGYEPDELYLSSEYLLTKRTGKLFDTVILKEKCAPNKIVHIGDNWNSDVVQPQKRKIITHHLAAPISQFKGENEGIYTGLSFKKIFEPNGKQYMGESASNYLGIRCMLALIANKIFDNPYITPFNPDTDFNCNPYYIGYYALGMHLYAVTSWVSEIAEKEKRNTIHFVSRDGYLPMKAYEILKKYRHLNSNANYLYISRKATALLQGACYSDIYSYLNSFSSYKIKIKTPVDTFESVASEQLKCNIQNLAKHNLVYMGQTSNFDDVVRLGNILFNEYIDKNKEEQFVENARTFFSDTIKENDILFDLGYRGNKEYILSALINRPVDCMYIYSNESKALQRANGRFSLRTFYDYTPSAFAAARELMFSEFAPSCVGYDCENGFAPVFDKSFSEHYFNSFVINTMQDAALDFVKDFEKTFSETSIIYLFRNFDASLPFEFFMNYSTRTDRNIFECVTFEDDTFMGDPSKMVNDWETALNYHKLNRQDIEKITIQTQVRVVEKEANNSSNEIEEKNSLPEELKDLCYDGLFVKAYTILNKKYPKGSKKRERLKKVIKIFIK